MADVKTKPKFRFDSKNTAAQAAARKRAANMITNVSKETKAAIRATIVESLKIGIPPYEVARRVKEMVGMTTRQASAAVAYRTSLVDSGLTQGRVDSLMARYVAKKISERAQTIARFEIMNSLNRGIAQSWVQARKEKYITKKQVAEIIVTDDSRLCPICEPLDGKQVEIDSFDEMPAFHARCRCTIGLVDKRDDGDGTT